MTISNNFPISTINSETESPFTGFIREIQNQYTNPYLMLDGSGQLVLNSVNYANRINFQKLVNYVNGLFAIYSRLIIIRLDLKYNAEFSPITDLQQVQADRNHFLANMRHNSLFNDLAGYIWKLEEGEQGGYHYHFIFFYTNEHILNHSYYAEEIGKYWRGMVTKGRGSYFSGNQARYRKQQLFPATGVVNYHDERNRFGLVNLLAYLCKDEQSLTNKPPKTRLVGTGQLPELREVSLGRPRMYGCP
ncbi:inovirus Gp2 family protein [Oxalobacter sp. OttesenSCG-928-P03]|nr:inovirus Gp2 family protein [Oxalobacter sp. OttesenSCG-928-P03]